jgi:hypothetical protein
MTLEPARPDEKSRQATQPGISPPAAQERNSRLPLGTPFIFAIALATGTGVGVLAAIGASNIAGAILAGGAACAGVLKFLDKIND